MENMMQKIAAAKQREAQKAYTARAAAMARFEKSERWRHLKAAGVMLALITLILINAWAAARAWGLE